MHCFLSIALQKILKVKSKSEASTKQSPKPLPSSISAQLAMGSYNFYLEPLT